MRYEWDNDSGWTPWRKLCAVALAVCVGAGIGATYVSHQQAERVSRLRNHQERVKKVISTYDEYKFPISPLKSCVTPGSEGKIIKNSQVSLGIQGGIKELTIKDLAVFTNISSEDERPFIRLIDGGQNITIKSKVNLTGIEYGDVEGWIRNRMVLRMVPEIPDIFPQQFTISSLDINGKGVPLRYVKSREADDFIEKEHSYLNLNQLVEDEILSEEDFEKETLEMKLVSKVKIKKIKPVEVNKLASMAAYGRLPAYIKKYQQETKELPANHPEIKKIVAEYIGDRNNVWGIIDYSLKYTIDSLEYCDGEKEEDSTDCPKGWYLPVVKLLNRGTGVCKGYSETLVTILRSFGVPARVAEGSTVKHDGSAISGRHAWVEACLPFKDGSYQWIFIEPTWADNKPDPEGYINLIDPNPNPRHLYHIDLDIRLDTSSRDKFYIFQEHTWESQAVTTIDMPPLKIQVKKEDLDK